MKKVVLWAAALIFFSASPAWGAAEILWPFFQYPPLFIQENGRVGGYAGIIQDLLIKAMPEYRHRRVDAPPQRMFADLKDGRPYFLVGVLKTPERLNYMTFSLPCRVAFTDMVVMRPESAEEPAPSGRLSLAELLQSDSLTMGRVQGGSFGPEIDSLIKKIGLPRRAETVSGSAGLNQLLGMLLEGRIDRMPAEPVYIWYFLRKMDLSRKLVPLPLEETPQEALPGFVGGPQTPFGVEVIEKINMVLFHEIKSGRLKRLHDQYIPPNLKPISDRLFQDLIQAPARQYETEDN